jgi:hypothetical protein
VDLSQATPPLQLPAEDALDELHRVLAG